MKQAIGYIRLSNEDQSSYSTDTQLRSITEYCSKYKIHLADVFEDNGASSYTFDRADFKKLETYIKKNKPEYIIVYHLDRFSRNLAEALMKIRELITKYNVRVRDITEPLELDDNDPNVFLMRSFRFMMAESELHRIRKRIKDGMVQGALSGRHLNMAPYGYKNGRDAENKPILLINEEKAFIVQMIYKEFNAGNGIEDVRRIVSKLGYSQKSNSAIQRILSNPVYIGKITVPGQKKLAEGLHAPIISEYDYWQAQELLSGRRKLTHQLNEEVFLRGVLKDYEGNVMTAGNSRGKLGKYYWYYVSRKNKINYSATKLHNQFYALLDALSLDEETVAEIKSRLFLQVQKQIDNQDKNVKDITRKLTDVKNRILSAEEKYMNEEVSLVTYKKTISQLNSVQQSLQKELVDAGKPSFELLDKMNELLPLLTNVKELFLKLPLVKQQQFIRRVFDNSLSYYNDTYRTPFLHPLFEPKALSLNENRLLIIEQPVIKLGAIPVRTPSGSIIETYEAILTILVA